MKDEEREDDIEVNSYQQNMNNQRNNSTYDNDNEYETFKSAKKVKKQASTPAGGSGGNDLVVLKKGDNKSKKYERKVQESKEESDEDDDVPQEEEKKKDMTDEEIKGQLKNIFHEYATSNGKLFETAQLRNITTKRKSEQVIWMMLNVAYDQPENEYKMTPQFLAHASSESIFRRSDFSLGLSKFLGNVPDIVLDLPFLFDAFSEVLYHLIYQKRLCQWSDLTFGDKSRLDPESEDALMVDEIFKMVATFLNLIKTRQSAAECVKYFEQNKV